MAAVAREVSQVIQAIAVAQVVELVTAVPQLQQAAQALQGKVIKAQMNKAAAPVEAAVAAVRLHHLVQKVQVLLVHIQDHLLNMQEAVAVRV
jgi:cellobiose-specific phosphotransferase system component IIA